ncbi:VOC family protein [Streptomyces barringtoniae]|uniref:VOC family protein n=1 Tax=Streptomyces barringtoniae TaxID=2892029 RepID=UPI001E64332E|nr:VOC family protein [Streptomyces barringtoniae]MCC5473710.1 VOC family protein [Streptomyces barringtoniae]
MDAIPPLLDHLVLATPDLAATVADFARRTGVTPVPGGAHPGLGTRNHLVGLGGRSYLEILGPDPEQSEPAGPRPFGVDRLPGPRTLTWAISPPDLDAAITTARARGYDPGPVHPMSRRTPGGTVLRWRLTDSGHAHPSGLVPFLIDWGASPHPTASGLPVTPLLEVSATAPAPEEVHGPLTALNTGLRLTAGPVALSFTVDTPHGPVAFG